VKVGSAVLAPAGRLDEGAVARVADDLAAARAAGTAIVLVSSGAVASGFRALGLGAMPRAVRAKQAAAAVGQPRLMALYARELARHGVTTAQVLLTADDFHNRVRFLNARHTLGELLDAGVLPIVNENDSVSFDEIRLGDNDRLSALTAGMVGAEALVILSTAPGLLDADGRVVAEATDLARARSLVTASRSGVGTGGFATKLDAVAIARSHGVPTVVTGGGSDAQPAPVSAVLSGGSLGTRFPLAGERGRVPSRKTWIIHAAKVEGVLVIDDGAVRALAGKGASLLPKGLVRVEGSFAAGAVVELRSAAGAPVGRGLASYGSAELSRIVGKRSDEIEAALGYCYCDEAVHRDDMALFDGPRGAIGGEEGIG
jgi:glutamate 5-kinase